MTATTTGPAITAGATDNSAAVRGAVETVESHLHPTPSWRVDDHPMPNGREEIWRFTPLKRFQTLLSEQAAMAPMGVNQQLMQIIGQWLRDHILKPDAKFVASLERRGLHPSVKAERAIQRWWHRFRFTRRRR